MPYSEKEIPEPAKDMPEHAQAVYRAAFNTAWERYADLEDSEREAKCHAVAHAAVKRAGYSQDADGKWQRQSDEELTASLVAEAIELADHAELQAQAEARATKYGIGVKAGGARTPPKGFPTDSALYGDPVNWAWPLDEPHVRAAESYFNHTGQRTAGGYTPEEWAVIGKRIAAACTKHLGGKYIYKDGKIAHLAEANELPILANSDTQLVTLHALLEENVSGAAATRVSAVEVARVGDYVDAHGKEIHITEADLDRMIENFTAQAAGQDIPIDVMHEKREAGGWLKRLWRKGQLLMAEITWNGLGARLVSDKVYRYLSASIAMPAWVLRSISLVNFPAIKGLAPVELSEWLLAQPTPDTVDQRGSPRARHSEPSAVARQRPPRGSALKSGGTNMAEDTILQEEQEQPLVVDNSAQIAEFTAALEQAKNDAVAKLSEQIVSELAEKREQMLVELRQEIADERELTEFALTATASGTHALPIKPEELKTVLKELPKAQRQKMIELLTKITQAGTVDLGEVGTAAEKADKRRLDPDLRSVLKQQMRTGMTLETFFKANPELGDQKQYDLAEFGEVNHG